MVYLDGSEVSIDAVRYAVLLARFNRARLFAIYVVDTKALEGLLKAKIFVESEELEYEHDLEANGKRYLKYARDLAGEQGLEITELLERGIVNREVVKKTRDLGIDLLVIGELKEALSRRDSFYDEAEQIFRRVSCPVLVVKEGEKVEEIFEELSISSPDKIGGAD